MASHDFNQPCDCRECREISKKILCPSCGYCHVVVVDRIPEWGMDRKGTRTVDFLIPEAPGKTFTCECGHIIQEAGYFTYYDVQGTAHERERMAKRAAAASCDACGKLEGLDYAVGFMEKVQLKEIESLHLCQSCLADQVQTSTKDPSDPSHKYVFDRKALVWKLDKVKVPCTKCGKSRWLNAENQWKKECLSCYRNK